ncbi:MAG: ribonuclease P Rpr2/Rpp21/SNM1 subunit family protein [Thermoplasmataceae archaeon]
MTLSKKDAERIARERISGLVHMARSHHEMSTRYLSIAENIAKRMDITLPKEIKRAYCKSCKHPYDGSSRIRVKEGLVTVKCGYCDDVRRIPYKMC